MKTPTTLQNELMNVAGQHATRSQWSDNGAVILHIDWTRYNKIGPFNEVQQFEGTAQVTVHTRKELMRALGY